MNKTKKILIILAITCGVVEVAWEIYSIVNYFISGFAQPTFYVVYYFIDILTQIAVVVMLTLTIWGNGKYFRQRHGLYMLSIVLSLIISLTSVSSILLICSMFVSDWVWEKPKKQTAPNPHNFQTIEGEKGKDSKEEQIARLREMKENGFITEEQFQEELMKLL